MGGGDTAVGVCVGVCLLLRAVFEHIPLFFFFFFLTFRSGCFLFRRSAYEGGRAAVQVELRKERRLRTFFSWTGVVVRKKREIHSV